MENPAAKGGDTIVGVDTHTVLVPSAAGPVPTSVALPFRGTLVEGLSETVFIGNEGAATVGSVAVATPPHVPLGGPFQNPPSNRATIAAGSETVFIEHQPMARADDPATCCNDPIDDETGHVVVSGDDVIVG